jgi:hypothetical protein
VSGKTLGKTVLGWFIVQEEEEGAQEPTSDELIAKYANAAEAAPPPPPPVELKGELPKAAPGAALDFPAVYRAASISDEEQGRVEKAHGLLQTLPAETPLATKKQIVEASLKAFGYPVDSIIEAGAQQIQALEAYIQHGERETQDILSQGTQRIAELTQQIDNVKQIMEQQVSSQQALTKASNEQKLRIQSVLEFFGQEAVARVVKESAKLVEPGNG